MSGPVDITVNFKEHQRQQAELTYLPLALGIALRDLAAIKGVDYLDEFYERAARYSRDTVTFLPDGIHEESRKALSDMQLKTIADGEASLSASVEAVKKDPTPILA